MAARPEDGNPGTTVEHEWGGMSMALYAKGWLARSIKGKIGLSDTRMNKQATYRYEASFMHIRIL